MKFLKALAVILFFGFSVTLSAQDSLNNKYKALIESSETFNQYKVIPRTSLDAFWSEVMDSLQESSQSIDELLGSNQVQADTIRNLTSALGNVEEQLNESLTQNDSISFLGLGLSKGTYHILVWSIIFVVVVLAVICYMMFAKSNRVTSRAKKELDTLQLAYDEHKNQSREKQVKLKRELQTALNTIEEMKRGRS